MRKGDKDDVIFEVMADARDQARVAERAATQEIPATGAGSGTVTSVAMTVPSILSVSGSPITTAGTFALTLANQSANQVWAGPTGGGAAAPTFRALVAADIPALSYGTGTVTSVALSLPSIFSVSGSPITGAGTLTGTLANQTANYGFFGPVSGGAAAPTFRAMVAADIPDTIVTYAKIQNVATARILGRSTAGAGVVEEISVGAGLTLTAGVLDTVGGAAITGSGTDTYLTRWTGASTIGDSTLFLSGGKLRSTASDTGLEAIRTGTSGGLTFLAQGDTFGSISIFAQDTGAVGKVGISLDSDIAMIRVWGNLVMHTDATYDFGASGANRARDAYLSRSLYAASIKLLGSGSGTATITPPAAAGTPTLTLPTTSGTLALTSDITPAVATKTADYVTTASDGTILVSASSVNIAVDLLTPVGNSGKIVRYKKIDSTSYSVTLVARSATVEAGHAIILPAQLAGVALQSDGSQWWVVAGVGSYTVTPAKGALWALNWFGQGAGFPGAGATRQRGFGRGKQYLFGQSFGGR